MEQARIDEIKALRDRALRDEYPEKVYGSAAYNLISDEISALLAEVERLTAENAKLWEKQTVKPVRVEIAGERAEIKPHVFFGKGTKLYFCPSCNSFVSRTDQYCGKCGQKLKWEG